jgi:hypothetical protein
VGSNRRYPDLGPQLAEQRALREARKCGRLESLTDEQLRLNRTVLSIVPDNVQVWALAWLRFGDRNVRACVRIWRWTDDAVGVEVQIDDERLRCWVWQGAVERLSRKEDAWR